MQSFKLSMENVYTNDYDKIPYSPYSENPTNYSSLSRLERVTSYKARVKTDRFWTYVYLFSIGVPIIAAGLSYLLLYLKLVCDSSYEFTITQNAKDFTARIVPDVIMLISPYLLLKFTAMQGVQGLKPIYFIICAILHTLVLAGLLATAILQKRTVCIVLAAAAIVSQWLALLTVIPKAIALIKLFNSLDDVSKKIKKLTTLIYLCLAGYIIFRLIVERLCFNTLFTMGHYLLGKDHPFYLPFITIVEVFQFIVLNWSVTIILAIQKAIVCGATYSYFNEIVDRTDSKGQTKSRHVLTWYSKVTFSKSFGSVCYLSFMSAIFEFPSDFINVTGSLLLIEANIPVLKQILDCARYIAIKFFKFYSSLVLVRCIVYGENASKSRNKVENHLLRNHGNEVLRNNLMMGYLLHKIMLCVFVIFAIPLACIVLFVQFKWKSLSLLNEISFQNVLLPIFFNTFALGAILTTGIKAVLETTVICLLQNPSVVIQKHPEAAFWISELYNIPLQ